MEKQKNSLSLKIKEAIKSQETAIKTARKNIQYRSENYYNCIDDYSSGGICDKAANETITQAENQIELYKEFLSEGEVIREFEREILTDLDDNDLNAKIVNGRFGRCWVYGNGIFVGLAKKESTYRNKGYKVRTVTETVRLTYFLNDSGKLSENFEILNSTVVDSTPERGAYADSWMNKWVYFARKEDPELENLINVKM